MNTRKNKVFYLGLFFLFLALAFNEFTLIRLLSPDGQLLSQNLLLLRIFVGITFICGVLLTVFARWIGARFKEILLFVCTCIACLALLEVAMRIAKPDRTIDMYQVNPHGTGSYRHKANYSTTFDVYADRFYVNTNSHGMTWREISLEKNPAANRIAFVGDSFTMGWLADKVEHSMVGVVDSLLASPRTEILNFGVGGYGTTDEELFIREEVLRFKPDTLVLSFFNGNDFKDVFLGLNKFTVTDGELLRNKETEARLPQVYRKKRPPKPLLVRIKRSVIDSFVLELKLYKIFAYLTAVKHNDEITKSAPLESFVVGDKLTDYTYWSQKNYPAPAVEARDETIASLGRIKKICDDNKIKLIIVTIPIEEQVYSVHESGENFDIRFPQKYVLDFAAKNKIPAFDLLPSLREYVRQEGYPRIYFVGDVHFNNLGYAAAGKFVANYLKSIGQAK